MDKGMRKFGWLQVGLDFSMMRGWSRDLIRYVILVKHRFNNFFVRTVIAFGLCMGKYGFSFIQRVDCRDKFRGRVLVGYFVIYG